MLTLALLKTEIFAVKKHTQYYFILKVYNHKLFVKRSRQ